MVRRNSVRDEYFTSCKATNCFVKLLFFLPLIALIEMNREVLTAGAWTDIVLRAWTDRGTTSRRLSKYILCDTQQSA